MDIKDLVLSSLEELENVALSEVKEEKKEEVKEEIKENKKNLEQNSKIEIEEDIKITKDGKSIELKEKIIEDENGELKIDNITTKSVFVDEGEYREFLLNLRERMLVLFEGLKSSNNKKVEAKVDLILNFFEYLLATIEDKLEKK